MASDPLSLLREFTINDKPVTLLNEEGEKVMNITEAKKIKFTDDAIFPRDTPTNFKKTNATDNETYTLETLIFLVQTSQVDNSVYFKECRTRGIEHVSIVDRRKILDYLTGKVDQSPNVSISNLGEKRTRDDANYFDSTTKKMKVNPLTSANSIKTVKEVLSREREMTTRSTILKGSKNFTHAINLAKQLVLGKDVPTNPRPNTTQKSGASQPSSSNHKSSSASIKPSTKSTPINKTPKLSSKDRIPIIIVPAAPTAKFTLYNIKQFLEEQKYVDSQVLREEGLKKPERVTVERTKSNGQIVPYHIVDSVANFKQNDWDRVCCVFVAGQLWQFKGWKWEKPVDLFSHVKGFYPKWSSDKINAPASEWAVAEMNIHRSKRHMDKATVSQFWDALDSYNATHKPYLNF
ncbi:RNA pol II accessory factor, Cdc73 family-domain-containing protein [Cokeromyces recurvatus]|uniref:RNA pol II accessory factor, Cdc73 family-domain-containing protein n=1 Tax=Cokeromyces recurvatus TaxID=90255 RepID=UPI00221F1425|nr:RNA pol II accessory factor, Cdc73 family-domain-containing protein [Cokeromyces recurvatus]KAI7904557.1 RNA pol II accessory factor, Cdc73 family-domain-containing protein [Cokeromyces recurvatus]